MTERKNKRKSVSAVPRARAVHAFEKKMYINTKAVRIADGMEKYK
jgi:hypothetical protein